MGEITGELRDVYYIEILYKEASYNKAARIKFRPCRPHCPRLACKVDLRAGLVTFFPF